MNDIQKQGIYLITNDEPFAILYKKLALLCPYVRLLQYRRKHTSNAEKHQEIPIIKTLCIQHGVDLIINDDIKLAQQFQCGVHLGQSDGSLLDAKKQLPNHLIGRTCHQSLALAQQAKREGADYVAFGAYHASMTKKEASIVSVATITEAVNTLNMPVCVIGGITIKDILPLKKMGVDYIAMINGLLAGSLADIQQTVNTLKTL